MEYKEDRREFLENLGKGLVGLIGAGIVGGCKTDRDHNEYLGFESHPVDQVFIDHDGFRLLYTDKDEVLIEKRYFSSLFDPKNVERKSVENAPEESIESIKKFSYSPPFTNTNVSKWSWRNLLIIKDLKEGERGFVLNLKYNMVRNANENVETAYTEVHLPRNQNISPGNEVFGGKLRVEAEMHEVK